MSHDHDIDISERVSASAGTDGHDGPFIKRLDVSAYTIPTDYPEADGTLEWNQTTLVVVNVYAAEHRGVGLTYGDASCARIW